MRGALDAPVVLVHYGDFECPYSGALFPVLLDLESQFGEKIAVVFRPFPLPDVHPHALETACAAIAAGEKFWPMHDLLFENQDDLNEDALLGYARQIGLDDRQFRAGSASSATRKTVETSVQNAKKIGIHGTPSLFINGQFHDNGEGLWEIERLRPLVEDAIKNASHS